MAVDIKVGEYNFKANGQKLKFKGFMTLYVEAKDNEEEEKDTKLPELHEKDELKTEKIEKIHIVGISLGAVLAQDFANQYPEAVQSLACFGGYDINNFDVKMQKENSASQILMMLKAIFSIKWFAKSNKKISAYTLQAQKEFYEMNIQFSKKSFMYLSSLSSMINVRQTEPRKYPLLIGCGKYDIPMELSAVEMWKKNEPECGVIIFEGAGHCVNMDTPNKFNAAMEEFWLSGNGKY